MKGIPFVLMSLLPILFITTSCQKNVSGDDPLPVNDSIYIQHVVILDTTTNPGGDTLNIFHFDYDASKRLSGYRHTNYGVYADQYSYTYQGSDTVPSRILLSSYDFSGSTTLDTTYYRYANGYVTSDSIRLYQNNGTALIKKVIALGPNRYRLTGGGFGTYDTALIQVTRLNGNVMAEMDSVHRTYITPPSWISYNYALTYDNHINPFYRILLPYPTLFLSMRYQFEANFFRTVNNCTGFSDGSQVYNYTYNTLGLPVICRANKFGQKLKYIYSYTNL